eukprot:g2771.t1
METVSEPPTSVHIEDSLQEQTCGNFSVTSVPRSTDRAREALTSAFYKIFPLMGSAHKREISPSSILSLVCSLGSLSFRAYDDPTVDGFREFTRTANRVQYVNYAMLRNAVKGVLKINLHFARNVKCSDFFSRSSDPYVVFSTGWSQVASDVKENDVNPVWTSRHCLLIKRNWVVNRDDSELHVRLYDSDWKNGKTEERDHRQCLIKDEFLGGATVDMTELMKPGLHQREVTLHLDGDNRTEKTVVSFSTEFLPFDEACEEMEKTEDSDAWMRQLEETANECSWTKLPRNFDISQITFQPVAFINAVNTGTQVWIHANTECKAMVVAFRGTESCRFKDVLNDFRFISSKFDLKNGYDCKLRLTEAAQSSAIRVHDGFRRCYDSIRATVMEVVYDITQWKSDWTICVTGHSLGGAVATICAFEFANRLTESFSKPRVIMMNFGAPRLGNKEFCRVYKDTVKESYRVINKMDIIHRIPFFLHHVDKEVDFDEDGEVKLGNQLLVKLQDCDVMLKDRGIGLSNERTKKLNKKTLFKTPGFKGHFEDYYFCVVMRAISVLFESHQTQFESFLQEVAEKQSRRKIANFKENVEA